MNHGRLGVMGAALVLAVLATPPVARAAVKGEIHPAQDIDEWRVDVFAGSRGAEGLLQGPAREAGLAHAACLCFLPSGEAFSASDGAVMVITTSGTVRLLAGTPGLPGWTDGPAGEALLGRQLSVAPDNKGGLCLGDRSNRCIRILSKAGDEWAVRTIAGDPAKPEWKGKPVDGTGKEAIFKYLHSNVVADAAGNIYVMDSDFLRRITPEGKVETLNPNGGTGKPGDGPLADARFSLIMGGAIDFGEGNHLLVADRWNHSVRDVDLDAKTVSTIAGGSREGYVDGPALETSFHGGTTHMAYDPYRKRIYVTGADDWGLRAVAGGQVYTIAGGNKSGKGLDAPARDVALHWTGVRAVDPRPPHDIYFSSGGKEWDFLIGRLYRPADHKGGAQ